MCVRDPSAVVSAGGEWAGVGDTSVVEYRTGHAQPRSRAATQNARRESSVHRLQTAVSRAECTVLATGATADEMRSEYSPVRSRDER
jgi:hypothetical protein